jgi:hypothetical protein
MNSKPGLLSVRKKTIIDEGIFKKIAEIDAAAFEELYQLTKTIYTPLPCLS